MYKLLTDIVRSLTSLPPPVIAVGFVSLLITLMGSRFQYAVMQMSLYIGSLSIFATNASTDNAVRMVALLLALIRMVSHGPIELGQLFRGLGSWRRPIVVVVALSTLSMGWSLNRGDTFVSIMGLVVMLVVILSMSGDFSTVLRATQTTIIASVLISSALVVLPSMWYSNRFHGVYQNANTLGVFAMMTAILIYRGWKPRLIPFYVLILGTLAATGSRASGVGAVLGTVAYFVSLRRNRIKRSSISIVITFAILLIPVLMIASSKASAILRVKDTRTGVWTNVLEVGSGRLLEGVGGGALGLEAGSSALRIFVEFGVIGAAIIFFVLARTVGRAPKEPWQTAMLAGLLGNSMFEAWMFSGGSGIFLACVLLTRQREFVHQRTTSDSVPSLI